MLNMVRENLHNDNLKLKTFLNPYSYILARKNKSIFRNFDIMIDGILLVKFLQVIGISCTRFSFDTTSLAPKVFSESVEAKKSIYFIGSSENVIYETIRHIKNSFRYLNIIGYRHGYFNNSIERERFLLWLVKTNPDIVVCGMGTVLQEKFLLDLQSKGWTGVGYTCGGFLHQASKGLDYYPELFNKFNLRWLFRFINEAHTRKRILFYYPLFIVLFVYDYLVFLMKGKAI